MHNLYSKLALTNIRKNKNMFLSFLVSVFAMVCTFYMLMSISMQSDSLYYGAQYMVRVLDFGVWVIGIVAVIVIIYTNSFLMKQRNRELGLYNVLGMEKKHIGKVIFWESFWVGLIGIVCGLIFGIIFSRLLFLIFVKMLKLKIAFDFSVPSKAVLTTVAVFALIFAFVIIVNRIRVVRLKPVDMLRETNAGEKEPKGKFITGFLGIGMLVAGYIMSMQMENALEAMNIFFVAVILVIIGTYMTFISGSIAILKLLKKNKKFYYHKTHFVTVSGMIYRMKQNAMGLASICILSTMVIVVLSSTVSLYAGIDEEMRNRYPKDVAISVIYPEKTGERAEEITKTLDALTQKHAKKNSVTIKKCEKALELSIIGRYDDKNRVVGYTEDVGSMPELLLLSIVSQEDYKDVTGESAGLSSDEYGLYLGESTEHSGTVLDIAGKKINVVKKGRMHQRYAEDYCDEMLLVVPKRSDVLAFRDDLRTTHESLKNLDASFRYAYDLAGGTSAKEEYGRTIKKAVKMSGIERISYVEDVYSGRQEGIGMYASILFIGIFIGGLFLMTTVLIIYYKQISEGYSDRGKFQIMEKIGLSKKETAKIINSQVRMVFILPIGMAVMHIVFAFPIINEILRMMNLRNTKLFCMVTVGTVVVFFLIYLVVYEITSKIYGRIVHQK